MTQSIYIDECLKHMESADRLLFITGAGVSAESGLPTYRGINGLYESELTDDGMSIEEALSGHTLATDAELTWKYLLHIARACHGKQPNRAHEVIAELQGDFEVCVITQNIDGFHARAGSQNLIEMHGNMDKLSCMNCDAGQEMIDIDSIDSAPRCSLCDGVLRPSVVLFGEMLPAHALSRYYDELAQGFDLVFSVGTTSVFPYISGPVEDAMQKGIPTFEINPGRTGLSRRVKYQVPVQAGLWLGKLAEALA